jgi:transposase-like protein
MVIETWKNSDMSVSQFCKAEGLSEGTFYGWRRRLSVRNAQRKESADPRPSAFIEIAMPKDDPIPIELLLSSGHTLRIRSSADNETLSKVLSVLRQVGLC